MNKPMRTLPVGAVFKHARYVVTDTLVIAEVFEKNHKNVLRDTEELLAQLAEQRLPFKLIRQGDRLKFEPISDGIPVFFDADYIDPQNRAQRKFEMNRPAFTLLAMRFRGAKALCWQYAFNQEFYRLEIRLRGDDSAKIERMEQALFRQWPRLPKVLEMMRYDRPIFVMAEELGVGRAAVSRDVRRLLDLGLVDAEAYLKWQRAARTYARMLRQVGQDFGAAFHVARRGGKLH